MNKKLRILICSLFSATAIFALAFAVGCDTETDTSDSQSTSVSDSGAENTDYDFTNATWSWTENSDGTYSVTVTVKDNNGGTDLTVTADNVTVTSEVQTAATCKATGITTYTATFTYGGNTYSATKDVVTAIDPDNHAEDSVTHTAAVASTADSEGNIEYWYCKDCGKYYSDEDLTTEITQAETVVSVVYTVSLSTSYDDATVAYTSKATFTALADGAYTFSLNAEDVDPDIYVLIESANSTKMVSATDTITILVAEGETVSVTLVDRNAQESSTYALDYTYVTYVSDAVIPEELVVDGDTIATLDTLYCGFNLEYTVSTDSEGEYTFTLSGDDLSGVNVTFYVVDATGGYSWLAWVGSSSTTTTVSLSAGTTIWIDASYNGEDEVSFVLTTTIGSGETEEESSGSSSGETDVETLTTDGGEWTLSQGETVDLYVSVGGSYTFTVDDEGYVCIWSDYAYSTIEDGVYIGDNYLGTRTVSLGEGETITIEAEYASTVTITYNSTEEEGSSSGDDKDAFNVPGETSITVAAYGEFLEYVEAPSTGYYTFTITCNSVDLDSTDRIYIYLYTDYEGDEKVSLNSSSYTYTTYYAESDIIQINIVNGDWEDDTFLLTITFSETDPTEEGSGSGESSETDVKTLTTEGGTYILGSNDEIKLYIETEGSYTFAVNYEDYVQLVSDSADSELGTAAKIGDNYLNYKTVYLAEGETITVTALYASYLTVTYNAIEEDEGSSTGEAEITVTGENATINIGDLVSAGTLSATEYTTDVTLYEDDYGTSVAVTAGDGVNSSGKNSQSVTIDDNSKSYSVIDDNGNSTTEFTSEYRLKLGGAGADDGSYRSIEISTVGACTITVYMMSSSSDEGQERTATLSSSTVDENGTISLTTIDTTTDIGGSSLVKVTYTISEAGTYYLASTSGGLNVYGIIITYDATSSESSTGSAESEESTESEDEVIDTTEEENEDEVIYTTEEESEDAIIDGE